MPDFIRANAFKSYLTGTVIVFYGCHRTAQTWTLSRKNGLRWSFYAKAGWKMTYPNCFMIFSLVITILFWTDYISLKNNKNATLMLEWIFWSLCLQRRSKRGKFIPVVSDDWWLIMPFSLSISDFYNAYCCYVCHYYCACRYFCVYLAYDGLFYIYYFALC